MNEQQALAKMIAPGTRREGKPKGGVIQIHVTRQCDKSCFNCTQGSNLKGPYPAMTVEQFEQALQSLSGYWGTVGMFGGNPALHKDFPALCLLMRKYFPKEQLGIWSNHPITLDNARIMRETFNPAVSNLNCHLDRKAHDLFKAGWPESRPFGLTQDSRHAPVFVAMKDLLAKPCSWCQGDGKGKTWADDGDACLNCLGTGQVYDEEKAWELISNCDINKHWSALIGVFRGELRAWFCEIAGAQAMLHQDEPDYPDTGISIGVWDNPPGIGKNITAVDNTWWQLPMQYFAHQVRHHCHSCGVPLRGYGELSQASDAEAREQVSATHAGVYQPKRTARRVEVVTQLEQIGMGRLERMTDYLGNAKR